jgi:hypothetical protein
LAELLILMDHGIQTESSSHPPEPPRIPPILYYGPSYGYCPFSAGLFLEIEQRVGR